MNVFVRAGFDGKVLLWDGASGRQQQALAAQGSAPVRKLAFNRNGVLLAGGAVDGKVWVWNTASLGALQQLFGAGSVRPEEQLPADLARSGRPHCTVIVPPALRSGR